MPLKALILMADYGHDPTETAVPYTHWTKAGISVKFATEHGTTPKCDTKMLYGITQKLLGATRSVVGMYEAMEKSSEFTNPLSWSSISSFKDYDIVLLPGGHDKGMRQIIDSKSLHELLIDYFPLTKKDTSTTTTTAEQKERKKVLVAICHGVMVLARAISPVTGKSVLHDVRTTTLPALMEGSAFWGTRLFLGDYYKTYGVEGESVEDSVKNALADPGKQWCGSNNALAPFVVEDDGYNYVSARFPGDAALMADRVLDIMRVARS